MDTHFADGYAIHPTEEAPWLLNSLPRQGFHMHGATAAKAAHELL
jgi:hypothetical protein